MQVSGNITGRGCCFLRFLFIIAFATLRHLPRTLYGETIDRISDLPKKNVNAFSIKISSGVLTFFAH